MGRATNGTGADKLADRSTQDEIGLSQDRDPVAVSVEFLTAVRDGDDDDRYRAWLTDRTVGELDNRLGGDLARLAFWINCYNATAHRALRANPQRYQDRRAFFGAELLTVAGRTLSLDDVEHDVLRRGYPKWTLGYLRWPFRADLEARLCPSKRDPRIHFALNCGAESCPIIRPYSRENVDAALDEATRSYLESTVEYDSSAGTCLVPRIFLWFRGDFGGKSGILAFLRRYDQLPPDARPRLRHREWDWTLDLEAFS
ncbi:MAG: DUF547 domain-containing protein [Salinirussus sp.]